MKTDNKNGIEVMFGKGLVYKGGNMSNQVMPLGSVKCHHMPESYYDKWEMLRREERRLFKLAGNTDGDCERWNRWERASRNLVEYENSHSTD